MTSMRLKQRTKEFTKPLQVLTSSVSVIVNLFITDHQFSEFVFQLDTSVDFIAFMANLTRYRYAKGSDWTLVEGCLHFNTLAHMHEAVFQSN